MCIRDSLEENLGAVALDLAPSELAELDKIAPEPAR